MTLEDSILDAGDTPLTGHRMKILYITQYFPPELGAAANRAKNLSRVWMELGADVTVVCQVPHYPTGKLLPGYSKGLPRIERYGGVRTIRMPASLAASGSSLFAKLHNQTTFFLNTMRLMAKIGHGDFDLVFATTPPIWNVVSGYRFSRKFGSLFVLDVRDLWPEVVVLDESFNILWKMAMFVTAGILHWFYQKPHLITSPVKPILDYLENFSNQEKLWLPNGVLFEEVTPIPPYWKRSEKFTVIYSGLLGRLQDPTIVFEYARKLPDVDFWVVGDGIHADKFKEIHIPNLKYWGTKSWRESISLIKAADLGLVLLKDDHQWLRMALPSKSMEYLALGKPVVVNNDGFLSSILKEYDAGMGFRHSDVDGLVAFIRRISSDPELYRRMSQNAIRLAKERFDIRKNAMTLFEKFAELPGNRH